MAREDHCFMDDVEKATCCIMSMYEPQTGRAETEKRASREELERMVGLVEAHVIMCLAGYFNGQEKKNRLGGGGSDEEQGIENW